MLTPNTRSTLWEARSKALKSSFWPSASFLGVIGKSPFSHPFHQAIPLVVEVASDPDPALHLNHSWLSSKCHFTITAAPATAPGADFSQPPDQELCHQETPAAATSHCSSFFSPTLCWCRAGMLKPRHAQEWPVVFVLSIHSPQFWVNKTGCISRMHILNFHPDRGL